MAILRVEPIMAAENCRESARVNVAEAWKIAEITIQLSRYS